MIWVRLTATKWSDFYSGALSQTYKWNHFRHIQDLNFYLMSSSSSIKNWSILRRCDKDLLTSIKFPPTSWSLCRRPAFDIIKFNKKSEIQSHPKLFFGQFFTSLIIINMQYIYIFLNISFLHPRNYYEFQFMTYARNAFKIIT